MAPLVLYAIFGTSRALAVGPVAVASLMTAAAAATVAAQGTPEYLGATIALAAISGLLLLALGLLRLGFLANFLSHPVISGFITASAIQIAAGQLAPVLGIKAHGESFVDLVKSMLPNLGNFNPRTAAIGFGSLAFLFWVRRGLKPLLRRMGVGERAGGHPREARARRRHRGDDRRRLGPRPHRARRQDRRHGPQGPAQARPAAVRGGALGEARRPRRS